MALLVADMNGETPAGAPSILYFSFKYQEGIDLVLREAKLRLFENYATVEYIGFSRPDNFNFRSFLEGTIDHNLMLLKGKSFMFGVEKAVEAEMLLDDLFGKLHVKFFGGFGEEELDLTASTPESIQYLK